MSSPLKTSMTSPLVVSFAIIFLGLVIDMSRGFDRFDRAFYDYAVSHSPVESASDVVVVAIDEASINELGAWPWDRAIHANLLEALVRADVVFYDVIFAEAQPINANTGLSGDALLRDALEKTPTVLPLFIEEAQRDGLLKEILPLEIFSESATALGHAHVKHDADGIVRGIYQYEGLGNAFWPHVGFVLANNLDEALIGQYDGGSRQAQDLRSDPFKIERLDYLLMRFFPMPSDIFQVSFVDVLNGLVPDDYWLGKRVFVGSTAKGLGDEVSTSVGLMSGVEFNVNVYQNVRHSLFIEALSDQSQLVLSVSLIMLLCWWLSRLPPAAFLLMTILSLGAVLAITYMLLTFFGTRFSPSLVVFSILLFYPLWSWRKVTLALRYLQRELDGLRSQEKKPLGGINHAREQLEGLTGLGVIENYVIGSSQQASSFRFTRRLPEDRDFYLAVDSSQSTEVVEQIFDSIEDMLSTEKERLVGDSYELVESTVRQLNIAQQEAEKSQRRMISTITQLQDAVIVVSYSGQVILQNTTASKFFPSSAVGESISNLRGYFGDVIWNSIVKSVYRDGSGLYQELDSADGETYLCQASTVGDQESETSVERFILFVFTKITELKSLEVAKNEALAFLSHDMRSPIVSQLALLENYKTNALKQEGSDAQLFDRIKYFAERSLKFSEDFLQLSRAENLDEQVFQLVDMHVVVDTAYTSANSIAKQKGVMLNIKRADEDVWVLGDSQSLERALLNLLTNAVQHSARGGEVSLQLSIASGDVCVSVIDTGAGIEKNSLPHLFQPYFRAKKEIADDAAVGEPVKLSRNYGLGLSFVHTVVQRHGGRIDVDSEIGRGTSIKMLLPSAVID